MYRTVFWTLWERARVGWFGRMELKHVYHMWNESPVQIRCMIQDAWGWCTGMTQWDGMQREVGGGFRMGNTCTGAGDGQEGLECCSPWGQKVRHDWATEMNWTELHTLLRRTVYLLHIWVALLLTQEGMKVGSSSKFIFSSSLYSLLREIYTSLPFCLLLFCLRS